MRSFHPTNPSAGNNVSATLIKQLIAEVRASRVIAGPGVTVRRTPNGTHVSAAGRGETKASPRFIPWKIVEKENPVTHEKKKEWTNKVLQIGLRFYNYDNATSQEYSDETNCEDCNDAAIDIDLSKTPPAIKTVKAESQRQFDPDTGHVIFHLGMVEDGKLVTPVLFPPVIYCNLT